MAAQLDGAGMAKMKTLDDSLAQVQHLHGIVERMAVAIRANQPTQLFGAQLRRAGTPLVGLLKGQFGLISDQVVALLLVATRGGNEQTKLRALREGVAQLRTQLEIAVTRVKERHATDDGAKGEAPDVVA
ncbi:MAG: hypothetical protein ACJ79S_11680 [Gemmatimonadaceae bacterium]